MARGIIFDMDGTMVNNMMVHHRAWHRKLNELGLSISLEEVKEKVHGVNVDIIEKLFGDRFTPEERIRISEQKEESYRSIFYPELKLIAGLHDFLELVHSAGIPMAVGTAAPGQNANFVVEQLDIGHYFKGVFHAGHVSKGKPDPEVFLLAAESMGLSPEDCLIFEDTVTGAEAARRADSEAVIITTTHSPSEFAHFDHIVRFIEDYRGLSLTDLPLDLPVEKK